MGDLGLPCLRDAAFFRASSVSSARTTCRGNAAVFSQGNIGAQIRIYFVNTLTGISKKNRLPRKGGSRSPCTLDGSPSRKFPTWGSGRRLLPHHGRRMRSGTLSWLRAMEREMYQSTRKMFGYQTTDGAHLMVSHDLNGAYCPLMFGCTYL